MSSSYAKGGVSINWTKTSELVTEYKIYRNETDYSSVENMTPIHTANSETFQYIDYDIYPDTNYYYSISSVVNGYEALSYTQKVYTGKTLDPVDTDYILIDTDSKYLKGHTSKGELSLNIKPPYSDTIKQVFGSDQNDYLYIIYHDGRVDVYDHENEKIINTIQSAIDIKEIQVDDVQGNFIARDGNLWFKYNNDFSEILWEYDFRDTINDFGILSDGSLCLYRGTTPRRYVKINGLTGVPDNEFTLLDNALIAYRDDNEIITVNSSDTYGNVIQCLSHDGSVLREYNTGAHTAYRVYDSYYDTLFYRHRPTGAGLGDIRAISMSDMSVRWTKTINSRVGGRVFGIFSDLHGGIFVRTRENSSSPYRFRVHSIDIDGNDKWSNYSNETHIINSVGRAGIIITYGTRAIGYYYGQDRDISGLVGVQTPATYINGIETFVSSKYKRVMFRHYTDGSVYMWKGRYGGGVIEVVSAPSIIQKNITNAKKLDNENYIIERRDGSSLEKINYLTGEMEWLYTARDSYRPIYAYDTTTLSTFYIGTFNNNSFNYNNTLIKLDEKRRRVWENTSTFYSDNSFRNILSTHDGMLIAIAFRALAKINPTNGSVIREFNLPTYFRNMYTVVYHKNHLYLVNYRSPREVCKFEMGSSPTIRPLADVVWNVSVPSGGNLNTPSLVIDSFDFIYVSSDGFLHKLRDSNGSTLWSNSNLGKNLYQMSIDEFDNIYAYGDDGTFNILNTEGEIVNSFPVDIDTTVRTYNSGIFPT